MNKWSAAEPEAVTIAAETIKQEFRGHPETATFGFGPPDGHPQCFCPRCEAASPNFSGKGLGQPSLSDLWFRFANAVAAEVAKEFPDRWLFTNGYANRDIAPQGVALDDHIVLMFAAIWSCTLHAYDDGHCWQKVRQGQMLKRWCELCKNVWIPVPPGSVKCAPIPAPRKRTLSPDWIA